MENYRKPFCSGRMGVNMINASYVIIWISSLIFSGYMITKTGDYRFLWVLTIPVLVLANNTSAIINKETNNKDNE